jgi:hypothetical protein
LDLVLTLSSCWDGKNLDTPNHKDHVAHPVDGPATFAVVNGKCPASHPVKIPQVHYEVRSHAGWTFDSEGPD